MRGPSELCVVAISASRPKFTGVRPFEPARDLFGVGRLLEEAFRPDRHFPFSNVPLLRDIGVFLWTLGYAPPYPENATGFVWLAEGRIVGNITLTAEEGRLERYLLSNVAVKPEFRQRGIARGLVQTALHDLRERGVKWALLNVRPDNADAIKLYLDLGFERVEMNGEYALPPRSAPPDLRSPLLTHPERRVAESRDRRGGAKGESGEAVRSLRPSDHLAIKELLRVTTPAHVAQFRTPRLAPFSIAWDERAVEIIADFCIGQTTRRYAIARDGKLVAALVTQAQRGPFPHRVFAQAHPDVRGAIERDLLARALNELRDFPPREIRASVTSNYPEWIAALEQAGFTYRSGLMLMAKAL